MDLLHEISFFITLFYYYIIDNILLVAITIAIVCLLFVVKKRIKAKKITTIEEAKKRTKVLKVFYHISLIFLIITMICFVYALFYDELHPYDPPPENYKAIEDQETAYFNSNFESYSGYQTGSNVSSLLMRALNAEKNYCSNSNREIVVVFNQLRSEECDIEVTYNETQIVNNDIGEINKVYKTISSNNIAVIPDFENDEIDNDYIYTLIAIHRNIESKHTYNVSFSYQENGLIDVIMISYEAKVPMEEVHREELVSK